MAERYREDLDTERCPEPSCTCTVNRFACGKCGCPVLRVEYDRSTGLLSMECPACSAPLDTIPVASKFQGVGLRTIRQ
jgi:hypothetical protein